MSGTGDETSTGGETNELVSSIDLDDLTDEDDINRIRWWFGWHPLLVLFVLVTGTAMVTLVQIALSYPWLSALNPYRAGPPLAEIIGLALVNLVVPVFAVAVVSLLLWNWGVRHVNDNWLDLLKGHVRRATDDASRRLAMDTANHYTFIGERRGGGFRLEPARKYEVTNVFVGDDSVAFVSEAFYSMPGLTSTIDTKTVELFYERITSVEASNRQLLVHHMDSDQPLRYTADADVLDVKYQLNDTERDLRERLREAKRVSD